MIHYGCDYYPEQWPESRWAEDARLMQEAGFNVARIGEFAWARMEPREGRYDWGWLDRALDTLAGQGIKVVLGTPTAAPPPWLTAAHPEILPRDGQRRVRHPGSRRHYCPNSPAYRDYSRRIVGALAERYGSDERVTGWQIDNEFGCHGTHLCYCDTCATRFREWLQARYGSLEALNEAWGGDFWSALYGDWDEVPLPWATPSYHNPGHVLDFRRFGSDSTAAYQQVQVDLLRALAPRQFVTHNFMPFGSRELDLYNLAAPLDLVSWDNYHFPGATPALVATSHDLYRGMKGRSYWVMEQQAGHVNWTPYNSTLRPGEVGLKVWQAIARGADGILFFRWRAAAAGAELYHSGLLDHGGRPTRGYQEARQMGGILPALAPLLEGSLPRAQVAFLHDYASRWALDEQPHNQALADDGAYRRALMGPYEALWARNVPADILPADILPARGGTDLARYRIVVAPALHLVSRELAERLAAYVRAGGTLIATARSGFKDEAGRVPGAPPGHLAGLLGVTVEEFDSQPPGRSNRVRFVAGPAGSAPAELWFEVLSPGEARPLAVYEEDYYAGRPAATQREWGRGRAIYAGLLAGADFYGPLFDWLLPLAGVAPLLDTPPGVEAVAREGPAGRAIFLLNHNAGPCRVALPPGLGDALSGEPAGRELALGPREVRILVG